MIMRSSQLMGGVCLDAKENGQIGGSDVVWDATDAGKATSKAQISYDFSKVPPSARACLQLIRIIAAANCTPARKFLASLS